METNANSQCTDEIMKQSITFRDRVLFKREKQLDKLLTFLGKSFNQQYRENLEKYQQENVDNRNSVLINQMNAQLIDLDIKKKND